MKTCIFLDSFEGKQEQKQILTYSDMGFGKRLAGFCVVLGFFFLVCGCLGLFRGFSLQFTKMPKSKPVLIKIRFWGGSNGSDLSDPFP